MLTVLTGTFSSPEFDEKEALCYAGCKTSDAQVLSLARSCFEELEPLLSYKACWCEGELRCKDGVCFFSDVAFESDGLSKYLSGYKTAVLFAATVGIDADRLIARYSRISPSRAHMLQAIATERIESFCDALCLELTGRRSRFSPGYGDLSLDSQKKVLSLLDCYKRVGITLNDSLLMSPTKSVTAFARKEL